MMLERLECSVHEHLRFGRFALIRTSCYAFKVIAQVLGPARSGRSQGVLRRRCTSGPQSA